MNLLILLMWAVPVRVCTECGHANYWGSHTVLACTHAHACRRVGSTVMVVMVVRCHASREGLWVRLGSAGSLMERGAAEGSAAGQQTMSQCTWCK